MNALALGAHRADGGRLLVDVSPLTAPFEIRLGAHRRRLLGGLASCLLLLGASVLVARHLSDASWPLAGARAPLVFLTGCFYLTGFGFRAFGWRQLFPGRERPDGARCIAACGAAAASGAVLPFRLDYVVKVSILRRLGGVKLGLETIAVSIIALGIVDAVAMLPLAIAAFAMSGPALRAPLIVVVLFCIGCLGMLMLAGMGATAGVLFALGVSKGVAVNFSLASALMLTGAALIAAALGLSASLLLSFRGRGPFAPAIATSLRAHDHA